MSSAVIPAEAARRLGVTPQRVHQLIRDGGLASHRVGNRVVVPLDAIEARLRHRPGRWGDVPDGMLTFADAAERLGVSVTTVRAWIRSGKLAAVRLDDGRVVIPADKVDA